MPDFFPPIWEWTLNNKEWVFSGIGITILGLIMNWLKKFFSTNKEDNPTKTNIITQTVNLGTTAEPLVSGKGKSLIQQRSKGSIPILFIDDNKVSFIPAMKKAGYTLIRYIKDCNNIHCEQVKDAEIIFVDVNGVGISLFPQEQGFGLARAIKQQFPSKCIVLYSAEPQYFRKDYKFFDSVLPKNSEPYEFTKIIDDWIKGNI